MLIYRYPIIFLLLLLFLPSLNCGSNEYDGKDLILKDGLLYKSNEEVPFTGKVKDYVNGKILEYEVKNGLKNGKYILHFSNGKVEIKGSIVENKNQGIWKYYYSNGEIESKGSFKDDLVNGRWYWYFPGGTIKEEAEFSNGLKVGDRIIYNPDGNIYMRIEFKNNHPIDTLFGN